MCKLSLGYGVCMSKGIISWHGRYIQKSQNQPIDVYFFLRFKDKLDKKTNDFLEKLFLCELVGFVFWCELDFKVTYFQRQYFTNSSIETLKQVFIVTSAFSIIIVTFKSPLAPIFTILI